MRGAKWRKIFVGAGLCLLLSFAGPRPAAAQDGACVCSTPMCLMPGQGLGQALNQTWSSVLSDALSVAEDAVLNHLQTVSQYFLQQNIRQLGPHTDVRKLSSASPSYTMIVENMVEDMEHLADSILYFEILPYFKRMASQTSAMIAEQTRALMFAEDARVSLDRQQEIQRQQVTAERYTRTSENLCSAATVMAGVPRAMAIREAYERAAAAQHLPRTGNHRGQASASGRGADQEERFTRYCARYANPLFNVGRNGCPKDVTPARAPDEDLDITSLVFERDTIDLTDDELRASVDDLVINLAEPFVQDPITSHTNVEQFMRLQAHKARMQTVYMALYHPVARRAAGSGLSDYVQKIRDAAGIPVNRISDNPSYHEVMQAMVTERLRSGHQATVAAAEPESLARQLVVENGLRVLQKNDLLDLMDRFALMVAGQTGYDISVNKAMSGGTTSAPIEAGGR